MNISKKSIIAGLGLALSLVSGLAQAGQSCDKAENYKETTLQCQFNHNSVPGNRTLELTVLAVQDDIYKPIVITPELNVQLKRGETVIKSWMDTLPLKTTDTYELNKTYSYKKGGLGQFNYTSNVSMKMSTRTVGRLTVTTNR